jgi:sugar-specific transcriptional regulator TrmB
LEQAIVRAFQASKDAQAAIRALDAVEELTPPEMLSYDVLELIREDLEERARRLSNEIHAVTREDRNLMMRHRWLVERNAPPGDDFGEFLRRRINLIERSAMASFTLRDAIDSVLLRQRDCFFDFSNWCIDEYKKNEQRTGE